MKRFLAVFFVMFVLLVVTAQIRYRSLIVDIAISQVIFAIAGYLFFRRGFLKPGRDYWLMPLSIAATIIISALIEYQFSNFHEFILISIGTPNLVLCAVGATYGALLACGKRRRVAGVALLGISGLFSAWFINGGSDYWYNYVLEGTFTGKIKEDKTYSWYRAVDTTGTLKEDDYKNKMAVLDFWNISCVACYKKFPYLDSLTRVYKDDKNIVFMAVNLPVANDSLRGKRNRELQEAYSFQTTFADTAAARMFRITGVPTVVIMQENKMIFKGSIELAAAYIAEVRR